MMLKGLCGQMAFALWLLVFNTVSQADPALIKFQSTITPPIWSPALPEGGIGGAILALLSKVAGVQYHIEYLPVKRFQQSVAPYRVGDPDLLAIQKPYAVLPIMLFRAAFFFYKPHHKAIDIHSVADLKGLTLGVLRGTIADKSYFTSQGVQIEENDSIESLLKKLKKGRIDVCIVVRIAGLYSISQLFPQEQENFSFVRIPKSERPVALIIDQDTAEGKMIAARYQKVLHQTLQSRQYREILQHYYGKDGVPGDWFEKMDKFERIYAATVN